MTPERLAELRARYPSLTVVAELADEVERLARQSAARLKVIEETVALGEEAARQRERFASKAQIYREQRDGAWSTVRACVGVISGAANLGLAASPDDTNWQIVAYQARHLLVAAGPAPRRDAPETAAPNGATSE